MGRFDKDFVPKRLYYFDDARELLDDTVYHNEIFEYVLGKPISYMKDTDIITGEQFSTCAKIAGDWFLSFNLAYKMGYACCSDILYKVDKRALPPLFFLNSPVRRAISKYCEGADVLDLGTGCGQNAIEIAKYCKPNSLTVSDISAPALKLAKQNLELNNVKARVFQSNLFQGLKGKGKYNFVFAHLPCSRTCDLDEKQFQGKLQMPRVSCDGGRTGMELYERFFEEVHYHLADDGRIAVVTPYKHAADAMPRLMKKHFRDIEVIRHAGGQVDSNDTAIGVAARLK